MADVTTTRSDHYSLNPPNAARWTCWIVGIVFLIIAILGFFGDEMVFGVFHVNTFHNWVHLLSGIVLFAMGFAGEAAARATLWTFAVIYGLVMLLGFFQVDFIVEALELNMADNWLHLLLTAAFAVGALVSHAQERAVVRRDRVVTTPRTP